MMEPWQVQHHAADVAAAVTTGAERPAAENQSLKNFLARKILSERSNFIK
jgi:hypothetical protein